MIEPAKLAALVEQQNRNPFGDMPKQGDGDMEEESHEDGAEKSPEERGKELLDSMGDFGDKLRESAETLQGVAENIGDDLKSEMPSEGTKDAVIEAVDQMPEEIVEGMKENLSGKSGEDLKAIGAALEAEQEGIDGELLGGLLKECAECVGEVEEEEDLDEEEGNPHDEMSEYDDDEESM